MPTCGANGPYQLFVGEKARAMVLGQHVTHSEFLRGPFRDRHKCPAVTETPPVLKETGQILVSVGSL